MVGEFQWHCCSGWNKIHGGAQVIITIIQPPPVVVKLSRNGSLYEGQLSVIRQIQMIPSNTFMTLEGKCLREWRTHHLKTLRDIAPFYHLYLLICRHTDTHTYQLCETENIWLVLGFTHLHSMTENITNLRQRFFF